jgi:nucleoside-triphosphatase THEP1/molybdopterin converting factor small subunit
MMADIHILTGPVDSGKTTFLREILSGPDGPASPAAAPSRPRDGYLSLRVLEKGRTEGYDLFNLADGSVRPFLRRKGGPGWPTVGGYSMVPETLTLAGRLIRGSRPAGLLIIDEIGPLEMSGEGVWPALDDVLREADRDILLVVRDSLLDACRARLDRFPVTVYGPQDRPALLTLLSGAGVSVKIRFFATFKPLFWSGERTMRLAEGVRAIELLRILCDSVERRNELFDGDDLRPNIVVLVNGTNLPVATGLETPLADGDAVSIFPLLGGG